MDINKHFYTRHVIWLIAVIALISFSCISKAVSIGEVVMQSKLGEPLFAQVDLMLGSGEHIEDSCLSLITPDPTEEDTSGYLSQVNLTLKSQGSRQYLVITSRKLLNDAFAKLRLQIKCPGMGSVIKTLTLLPDLNVSPPTEITSPNSLADSSPDNSQDNLSHASQLDTYGAQSDVSLPTHKKVIHAGHKHPKNINAVPASNRTHGKPGAFKLKLSGESLDASRIGKISQEERAILLAKQKMLDADDETANFLAMEHQVKQLQDELGQIKLQLAQLGISPIAAASSNAASSPSIAPMATSAVQASKPKPAATLKQPAAQENSLDLQSILLIALLLLLAVLALWTGLRHYSKIKSRISSHQYNTSLLNEETHLGDKPIAPNKEIEHTNKKPPQTQPPQPKTNSTPLIATQSKTSSIKNESPAPHLPQFLKNVAEVNEEDSVLEEAELYAAHGRPAKAAEILLEIIKLRPSKAEAWPLLFSIYSSLGKAEEFERTAKQFLIHHKDSPSWRGIQALGRTLDRDNPIYIDNSSYATSPAMLDTVPLRRPVGDVLLDMGVLSKQDLQNCLDDFDPKRHGRFGGYLVARKVITLAQLDEALLQQQGIHSDIKTGSLPSLQEMENFLADFDPKRDGSVNEFLASRNAVTPVQLSKLLQQQPSPPPAPEPSPESAEPPLKKEAALGFEFEARPKVSTPDLEFTPANGKNIRQVETVKSSETNSEEPNLNFPEINFDLGQDNLADKK